MCSHTIGRPSIELARDYVQQGKSPEVDNSAHSTKSQYAITLLWAFENAIFFVFESIMVSQTSMPSLSRSSLDEANARISSAFPVVDSLKIPHYDTALALSATCASITSFTFCTGSSSVLRPVKYRSCSMPW